MNYKGTIIEESLEDNSVLKEIKILSSRVVPTTERHRTPWVKQWTLHAVEVSEDKAEGIAAKISRAIDKEKGHAWYADYKNDSTHFIIFRDKVFFVARKSKAQYEEARRYGLSLGIPEYQLIQFPGIDTDALANFLNEANKSTYANATAKKALSTRLNSEDYHFERENLAYHDTYFGSRDFIGEEIVYDSGRSVWGANYFGRILDENTEEKELYDFLRKALMQEYNDVIPVRGPKKFSDGKSEYRFAVTGDLANFTGQEEILIDGKVVYHLLIHGGFIG